MSLYYPDNARHPEQADAMRRLEIAGTCIFCPGNVDDAGDRHVALSARHWVVRHNAYPYPGTRLHLLAIPRRHVPDLLDLGADELAEFWEVARNVRDRYGLEFYGLGARCGDCAYTGGTVRHVHVHLVVGDVDDPAHTPVRLKLSSRPPQTATAQSERTGWASDAAGASPT